MLVLLVVPEIPESLSSSLDMTSELPKMRSAPAEAPSSHTSGSQYANEQYANDMTMELPIFRELESAWFRTENAPPPPPAADRPSEREFWDYPAADNSAAASFSPPGASPDRWSPRSTGSEGARRAADEVSWRSVADDGWLAAKAATDPRDGGSTEMGLPRRVPMAQLVPGGVETPTGGSERRTPDAVRGLLSAYHSGVQRGRDAHGNDAGPTSSAKPINVQNAGSQTSSGREQEA